MDITFDLARAPQLREIAEQAQEVIDAGERVREVADEYEDADETEDREYAREQFAEAMTEVFNATEGLQALAEKHGDK